MKNNNRIKYLTSQFEEVRKDSKDFRENLEKGRYGNISEMKLNYTRFNFLERKIDILQETLLYLIEESQFEGNINGKW
jgi:hypothetical protein|nr:MAG TPA: hypothetical protein [Caudoviricetes sp.]